MDIGMFGSSGGFYFFFMQFNISYYSSGFKVWFQIGDSNSDWQGVSWGGATSSVPGVFALDGLHATNTDFSSSTSNNYDNDSWFFGQIDST